MKRKMIRGCALLLILVMALCLFGCEGEKEQAGKEDGGKASSIFAVTYRGTTIELGKDAKGVLEALGEPTSKAKVASCGDGAGDQWQYVYSSIYLFTVKNAFKKSVHTAVFPKYVG